MNFWRLALVLLVGSLALVRDSSEADPEPTEGGSSHEDVEEGPEEHEGSEEDHGPHWSYHDEYYPARWSELHALCSSESPRQSPIDIHAPDTIFEDELLPIHLSEKINKNYQTMDITNNGHSVNIGVPHEALIAGGDLPSVGYKIAGVHFHWGSSDKIGSEHTVMDKAFPLEMHMVSYDTERYDEVGDAIFGDNSLAVLGTMFMISEENNTVFDPIIAGLRKVREPYSTATISHFNLGRLLPPHTNKYFRYLGSLTTPPCAESVVWTLFLHTQSISSSQMKEFRLLMETPGEDGVSERMVDNYRPVQQLKGRVVSRSFLLKSEVSQPEAVQCDDCDSAASISVSASCLLVVMLGKLLHA